MRVVLVVNQNKVLRFVSQVSSNTLEIKDSKIIWPGKKTTKPSGINISTELKVNIRIKQLVREKRRERRRKVLYKGGGEKKLFKYIVMPAPLQCITLREKERERNDICSKV